MTFKNLLFIVFVLTLTSCQKEINYHLEAPNNTAITGRGSVDAASGSGGATGEFLVKIVAVTGNETVTTNYTYDSLKRLITEHTEGITAGMPMEFYSRYYREPSGRIYKVAQFVKQASVPLDTIFTIVYYPNATTYNFSYATTVTPGLVSSTKDSAVYTYNTNSNLVSQTIYKFGSGSILSTIKWDYNYSGGNLVEQKAFSSVTGTMSPTLKYVYSYDNYTNPILVNGEFVLTGRIDGASVNNITKVQITDLTTTGNDHSATAKFVYGDGGKPVSGSVTQQPGNRITKYTFYYK